MQRNQVSVSLRTVGIVLGFILSGCSTALPVAGLLDRKTEQCNRLIEVANRAVVEVQAVTRSSNPRDVAAMSKIANITDQTAATMQSLNIRDEQLHRFRDRFVKMYTDTSQATRSLASARNQQNNTSAQQAYSALQTATNQEGTLVTEINTYCRGGR